MAGVTLHDVAREAGVSIATASRVLNGSTSRKVAEDYRERVLAAARRLNYIPNLSAQAVVRGTSNLITLVVPDISDPYFSTIAAGVARRAADAHMVVMMAVSEREPTKETQLVRSLRGQRPAVMILTGSRYVDSSVHSTLVEELLAYQEAGGFPVILGQDSLPLPAVVVDNRAGATALAHELVALGYRSPAILAGQPTLLTALDRVQGFQEGFSTAGVAIADHRVVYGEFTRAGGHAATMALLDRGGLDGVDLIFAANDVMAVGALAALRERGLSVPGDVALAGYDDVHTSQDVFPALTTVRIPLDTMGELAVDLALNHSLSSPVSVTSKVVIRASTPRR